MVVNDVFFNDTATTEIYTLSLHDALPIFLALLNLSASGQRPHSNQIDDTLEVGLGADRELNDQWIGAKTLDRKSTRLNSSHANISYAVFCLKKKQPLSCGSYRVPAFSPPR